MAQGMSISGAEAPADAGRQPRATAAHMEGAAPRTDPGRDFAPLLPTGPFLRVNICIWLLIAGAAIVLRIVFYDRLETAIGLTATLETTGFLYTCLLHLVYRHLLGRSSHLILGLLLAGALSLAGAFGQAVLAPIVREVTNGPLREGYSTPYMSAFFYTPIFGAWSIGYFWIGAREAVRREYRRRTEAETAALRAELRFLQTQLDPHFLFNALNTISAEIPERPAVALQLTRAVASFLRGSLQSDGAHIHPLSAELRTVRDYITIQELRFDGRLACRMDIAEAALPVPVPCLVLQGLVENAIKHGRPEPGGRRELAVQVRRMPDAIEMEVINRGTYRPGGDPQDGHGTGLGVENTRRRIAIAYPGRHRFDIRQAGPRVIVRLRLEGAPCFA